MLTQLLSSFACILLALAIDKALGEPKRLHPLVLFGHLAARIEQQLNHANSLFPPALGGIMGWSLAIIPIALIISLLAQCFYALSPWLHFTLEAIVLYLCIGWRSLKEHMLAIYRPLADLDIEQARQACAMIVSRNTAHMGETEIASAAVESTLENGMDGIFSVLFWFALFGIPGAIVYRLSNTLDAMWGYRTPRFEQFGKWSAKFDDALNWLPARLTALIYMLAVHCHKPLLTAMPAQRLTKDAFSNWRSQAPQLSSPNGGPVMVTGATVLGLRLGGPTVYHGELTPKPYFGGDTPPKAQDITHALTLIDISLIGWIALATLLSLVSF